jgi:hypothetical protein
VAILKRLQNFRQGGSKQLMFLNIVAVISLAWVVYKIALTPDLLSVSTVRIPHIEVPNNMFWMLFTMAALPLFFQFVDMTNWQRLSSLSGDDTGLVIADAKKGLRFFLLESPLSWLFPIAIGMSAAAFLKVPEGKDAWVAFVDLVTSIPGKYGIFLAAVAVVGILSIFLSTAVSLLTASGYAFAYDVYPRTRVLMDTLHSKKAPEVLTEQERDSVVTVGVYATSVAILVSAVVYILFDLAFPELRMTLLYFFLTFYSPMLAFAPSILIPIRTGLAANGWVALCSMAVSAVLGLAIGIYSLFSSNEIWQWLGVPVCFLSSWVIYLGGFMFSRHAVNGPEAPHPAAA